MVTAGEVEVIVSLKDEISAHLTRFKRELDGIDREAGGARQALAGADRAMSSIRGSSGHAASALGTVTRGLGAIGLAGMGISTITSAAQGLGNVLGLGLAGATEQTRARFQAFTKDAGETQRLLGLVREEAARTPFGFQEMSAAMASLLPVSKASGLGIMDLVKQAEILAASNPLESLEGASFALKEAVSGDFTSVIERFNLSRKTLNDLKDQGVPALEAVQIAMKEMGLDSDLVAAQAQTMAGRWSTFKDTLDSVKLAVATPIFDALSGGLTGLQTLLEANQPRLTAFATAISTTLVSAVQTAGPVLLDLGKQALDVLIPAFQEVASFVTGTLTPAFRDFVGSDVLPKVQAFGTVLTGTLVPAVQSLGAALSGPLQAGFAALQTGIGFIADHKEILTGIAAAIVAGYIPALVAWTAAEYAKTTALIASAAAFVAANAPLVAAAVAVGAITAAVIWLIKHWDDITAKVPILGTATDAVKDAFGAFADLVTGTVVPALQDAWQWFDAKVMPTLRTVAAFVGGALLTAFKLYADLLKLEVVLAIQAVKVAIDVLGPPLRAIGAFVGGALLAAFKLWAQALMTEVKVGIEAVKIAIDLLKVAFDAGKTALDAAKTAVDALKPALQAAGTVIEAAAGFAASLANGIQAIGDTASAAVSKVLSLLGPLQKLVDLKDKIGDFLPGSLPPLAAGFQMIGEQAVIAGRQIDTMAASLARLPSMAFADSHMPALTAAGGSGTLMRLSSGQTRESAAQTGGGWSDPVMVGGAGTGNVGIAPAPITVNVSVYGNILTERELVDLIADAVGQRARSLSSGAY